ncbi:MAG: NAD-dependent deacylase [Deltaproteobacteria bacterium]|nr:NAD-dependent deacylase [Deltaproteobacteria bacterium]
MAMLHNVARLLQQARRVAVLTGAGVSQESGVPTFRGPGGLWRQHRPEDLATPEAFAKDPRLVWEWYDWRRGLIAEARPNPGHLALAALEDRFEDFTLITQNVDGLHRRAGSRQVVEIHGSIWEVRCLDCGDLREDRRAPIPILPTCSLCGGLLRPNVVWFGEALDPVRLEQVREALVRAQVMLLAGTSAVVQPAAAFGLWAQQAGAVLVEINPVPTPLSLRCDYVLKGPAGEILPALLAALPQPGGGL